MSEQNEVQYSLTINTEYARENLRKIEVIIIRVLGYIKRLTGSEQLDAAIDKFIKLITTVRTAQITLHAFEVAAGPVGWAFAVTSAVGMAFTASDFVGSLAYHEQRGL